MSSAAEAAADLLAAIKSGKSKFARTNRTTKLKEGKTRIRLLRPAGEAKFWRDLGVHWIKTDPSQNAKPVAVVGCHDVTYEDACPVCTAINKALARTSDDDTVKLIKSWEARKSVLVNALIRDGANASEDKPVVLELTTTTFSQILGILDEYLTNDVNVLDYDTGMDLMVERRGAGLDTEYTVTTTPKSNPVSKAARTALHDLDEFIKREFFKGDETKALRVIAGFVGDSSIASIGAPRNAALTGSSAAVADAEVIDLGDSGRAALAELEEIPVAPKAAPAIAAPAAVAAAVAVAAPATAAPAPAPADDVASILAELDGI